MIMAHKKETRTEGEIERGEGGRGEVWGLENEEGKGWGGRHGVQLGTLKNIWREGWVALG